MSSVQLEKIQPKFRHLVDLLMFSNRTDIDLQDFRQLLCDNNEHSKFLIERFKKSSEIFWEDNESFWINRISFIFSLNDKLVSKGIERFLEQRMFTLTRTKHTIDAKYDLPYTQFISYCKVKFERKESLLSVKKYLSELPSYINADKLIKIINSFIPTVFKSMDEYAEILSTKITQSARNFEILQALEKQNVLFDRQPLVQLAKEIITERSRSNKNILAFFSLINDQNILKQLKSEYTDECRSLLLDLLNSCEYQTLEEYHLRNFKNLLALDIGAGDDIAIIYANKLYARRIGHKRSNADRLIRLLKTFTEISPKKILAYLSANNKMSDIKYIIAAFPKLKKLAAFV